MTCSIQKAESTQTAVCIAQVWACPHLQHITSTSGLGFLTLGISADPGTFLTTSGVVRQCHQFGYSMGM